MQTGLQGTLLAPSLPYDAGAEENPDAFCFKVSGMYKWVLISRPDGEDKALICFPAATFTFLGRTGV